MENLIVFLPYVLLLLMCPLMMLLTRHGHRREHGEKASPRPGFARDESRP